MCARRRFSVPLRSWSRRRQRVACATPLPRKEEGGEGPRRSRLTEIIYPSGRYVDYAFDSSGYLTTVTTKPSSGGSVTTLASSITHKPFGPISGLIYGNSEALTRSYDNNYWPTVINTVHSGSYIQELSLGEDDAGNITSITDTLDSTRNESFGVDGLNRLHTASGKYGSRTHTYDNNSNWATKYDGMTTWTTTNVSSSNLPDHITDGTNTRHFTWTANGNMASDDRTFVGGGAAAFTYSGASGIGEECAVMAANHHRTVLSAQDARQGEIILKRP